MKNKFKVGDIVRLFREPTEDDWKSVSAVDTHPLRDKDLTVIHTKISLIGDVSVIRLDHCTDYVYPESIFELVKDEIVEYTVKIIEDEL